ncbi:MAG: hypothetical protein E7453_06040 [Ruminococcaceae bacterium]|nr:hypothetical protein [Oscillospiraceae bacterium]
MKREFLANLKVNGEALPKEIIDTILDENSRDIGAVKAQFSDYDTLKQQLDDAQKTIQGFKDQGTDLETVRKTAQDWEEKYNKAVADHKAEMAERDFQQKVNTAITGAKGKNAKAISALLDIPALRESKNQDQDIAAALEELKKESGYMFDTETPPPYARGTGTGNPAPAATDTLAGALRERYNK